MYNVLGLMSGTSLDGLDIALCSFEKSGNGWSGEILSAETVPYPAEWQLRLKESMHLDGLELSLLDTDLGTWFGKQARTFLERTSFRADFIASHGHTVFHRPELGMTLQIGRGSHLAASSGLPVICDFRSVDVALGGQGAPLVPVGDRLLFGDYDFCLNLGGFANISYEIQGERIAFDICPANMALNLLAAQINLPYDAGGEVAASGVVQQSLLRQLNELDYYRLPPPKSLGKEWFDARFLNLLKQSGHNFRDLLATCTEHIAVQVGQVTRGWTGTMLVTGGGAWNEHLIRRIAEHSQVHIVVPDPLLVNFKEALIFAFLGVLYSERLPNALASVTGASMDSIGGCMYHP